MARSLSNLKILEKLSSDLLDDDFVKCFWPMHTVQMCLGSSRVDLVNKYVTKPTGCQKIYTVLWILATVGSTYHLLNHYYKTYHDNNIVLYYILATAGCMQSLPSVLNLIHVRFFNGSKNVELYVTMQKIDRTIGLDYIRTINLRLFKLNLCYAFFLSFGYLAIIIIIIYIKMKNPMFSIFLGFSIVSNYMEIALQEHLIYFLVTRLQCVNETLKAHLVENRRCQCSDDTENRDLHDVLCDEDDYLIVPNINECFTSSMSSDNAVKPIKFTLKAFKIINKTLSFQVMLTMATVAVFILLIIVALVVGQQTAKFIPLKGVVSLSVWMLLNFTHVIMQSMAVELFLSQVRTTKRLCIRILSLYYDGPLRKTAKRILTMLEATPRFSVYDMFALDKRLPLKLIGLITTYVLLFMQFTLL